MTTLQQLEALEAAANIILDCRIKCASSAGPLAFLRDASKYLEAESRRLFATLDPEAPANA